MTPQQLENVFALQKEQYNVKEQILHLTGLIKQLANEPCTACINFMMRNEKQEERNDAANTKARMDYEQTTMYLFDMSNGVVRGIRADNPPAINQLVFSCTEPTAMRILSALLEEKKLVHDKLQEQIEGILIPEMKIEFIPISSVNPIEQLHDKPYSPGTQ